MPNIEDFSAGNIDIRPQEVGVEATAAAGRRLGAYGSQIAQSYTQAGHALGQAANAAEQYLEHREINTGAAHGADLIAAKNQSWTDFITGKDIPVDDPARQDKINQRINNPQAGKQWREQSLEPDLQQFEQGFLTPGGRQWASQFSNRYRLHMAEHTAADQSSMAGAVAQANHEKMENSLAAATFSDPSSLRTNLDLLTHGIKGTADSSPVMTPAESIKFSVGATQKGGEKLVQAAIQGSILKGGNWKAIANDPAYSQYVKPAENAQFDHMQKIQDHQDRLLTTQLQNEQKRAAEFDLNNTLNASSQKNVTVSPDGTMHIDPQYTKDVNNLTNPIDANGNPRPVAPNAWKVKEQELSRIEHLTKNPAGGVTDPAIRDNFNNRLDTLTTQELRKAQIPDAQHPNGRLSTKDFGIYEGYIKARDVDPTTKNPAFKYATEQVKAKLEGGNPIAKLHNAGKFAEFMQDFVTRYTAAHRAGPLPDNVLNLSDPNSMISQTLKSHAPNLGQSIQLNGGVGAPLKTGPIAPPLPKTVPQASM